MKDSALCPRCGKTVGYRQEFWPNGGPYWIMSDPATGLDHQKFCVPVVKKRPQKTQTGPMLPLPEAKGSPLGTPKPPGKKR